MDKVISKILGEDKRDREKRAYVIEARPDHLDKIEELFSWINMTRSGHSGEASISIDGDGAARVEIERKDGELKKYDEDSVRASQRVEFKVDLD